MLPRAHRLRSEREFQRVYRSGRSWAHPLVALYILPQPEGQRVGIVVGRKLGGAVQRNRVRRRLREIVRQRLGTWKVGFDAVFVARKEAADAAFADLAAAVDELAQRARLLRAPSEPPETPYRLPAGGRRPEGDRAAADRAARAGAAGVRTASGARSGPNTGAGQEGGG